jgi:phosphate uptake regulator
VSDALQAFVTHDMELAVRVAGDDDAVDELCDRLQRELIDKMREDPTLVEQATRLLLVARVLERTADHATNIVEQIYYVETGEMRPLAREEHDQNAALLRKTDHHALENLLRDSELPFSTSGTNGASEHIPNVS